MIRRFMEWLWGIGWSKNIYPEPVTELLCGGRRHPHYYGRGEWRGITCLRCGHERSGK